MKKFLIGLLSTILLIGLAIGIYFGYQKIFKTEPKPKDIPTEADKPEIVEPKLTSININAVGDCTIGYDPRFGYEKSFNEVYDTKGEDYFFSGVKDIFASDDLTIANLETTFTDSNDRENKAYTFKAPISYATMLPKASIEAVNLANNHIYDYKEQGYEDTINTLDSLNIKYFGFDNYYIYHKDDIAIGLAGIACYEDQIPNCKPEIDKALNYLKSQNVDTFILSFHWGIEATYNQTKNQTETAHYAIDNGADLVIGHHPHRIQGLEMYNGKYIVYSLGNFSFGGHKSPSDRDSFIFNITFNYQDKELIDSSIKLIPVSISSVPKWNDYRPMVLEGTEKTRVINKIAKYSVNIDLNNSEE